MYNTEYIASSEIIYYLTIDDFFNKKSLKQNIGIASIPKQDIYLDFTINSDDNPVSRFFRVGKFIDIDYIDKLYLDQYSNFGLPYLESIPKLAWLLEEYVKLGKFKNPVGLLYNTRIKKFEIHPGQSRKYILHADNSTDYVDALVYSTEEYDVEFKKIFYSKEDIENYFKDCNLEYFVKVFDNNLIPEIHLDAGTIRDKVYPYIKRAINTFRKYEILADFDLSQYGFKSVSSINYLDIKTNNSTNYGIQILALAAASLQTNINLGDIKVSVHSKVIH